MQRKLTIGLIALLSIFAIFALMGHPLIPHDVFASLGTAGMMPFAGEIDLKGVKEALEKQGGAWEEYKKTNDARLKAIEEGKGTADLEAKLAEMEKDLKQAGDELKEIALKSKRPQLSSEGEQKAAAVLKAFNAKGLAAAIEAGKSFAPLSADGYAEYKAAMSQYIRQDLKGLSAEQLKAINVGNAGQGGFLVGEEMEAGIDRVIGSYSSMRQIATVRSIGQASYKKLVKVTGTSGAKRGGENTTPTNGNSPSWVELEFKAGTYISEQRITSEALEDAVQDVESDLQDEIGMEFAEMEGSDFIDGDGINGPRGLLAYGMVENDGWEWGKVGYVKSGGAAAFAATNPSDRLIDLQHSLKRQFRANAVWTMNDATLAAIRKFKDGNGIYLWAPSGLLNGVAGQLLGHGVVTDDFMPDLGANTFPVAFGDFKRAYYVIDRKGIAVLRDAASAFPHVRFLARKRVGGGIANFQAVKLLKCEA
ncbi:phage major capsid protein [Massilia agilis]